MLVAARFSLTRLSPTIRIAHSCQLESRSVLRRAIWPFSCGLPHATLLDGSSGPDP
jgi:hypothetical protein